MTTSIIGLFESGDVASKVADALTKTGIKKDAIDILEDVSASKISSRLIEAGYQKDQAERYGKAMRNGGALIVAEARTTTRTTRWTPCGVSMPSRPKR